MEYSVDDIDKPLELVVQVRLLYILTQSYAQVNTDIHTALTPYYSSSSTDAN